MDETLNDFVIGNGTTVDFMRNEGSELEADGHHKNFVGIVDSASQNQVIGSNTDDRIRNAVDSAVIAVKNCLYDVIFTAMNNVVIPRVEMPVRLITGSSGNGPNSLVQKPDRRDFMGSTENTPLRLASGRLDSDVKQYERNETRNIDNSEDGDCSATRLNYDRRAHANQNGILLINRFLL